jgi:hypothetical protein
MTTYGRFGRWYHLPLGIVLAALLAAGCGGSSGGSAAGSTGPSPTSGASSADGATGSFSTAAPTAHPSGSLPPEAAAKPGAKYYAVFLAVATDANDPALDRAEAKAKTLGYSGGVGDINCTPGARETLNLSGKSYTAFSIFFATSSQAQDFVNGYPGTVVGTAYVTAGCLD